MVSWVWWNPCQSPRNLSVHFHVAGVLFLSDGFRRTMSKEISMHRRLIDFFSDVSLNARGFRPAISPRDAAQLKRALNLEILDHSHWEQVMLYFLADRSFKNLSPSIATMLSSTVINGLRNKMLNREQFYKELETYSARHLRKVEEKPHTHTVGMVSISDRLQELSKKLSFTLPKKPPDKKATRPRAPAQVGLFGRVDK